MIKCVSASFNSGSFLAFLDIYTGMPVPGVETPLVHLHRSVDEREMKVDVRILGSYNLIHRNFKSALQDILIRDWKCGTTFVVSTN